MANILLLAKQVEKDGYTIHIVQVTHTVTRMRTVVVQEEVFEAVSRQPVGIKEKFLHSVRGVEFNTAVPKLVNVIKNETYEEDVVTEETVEPAYGTIDWVKWQLSMQKEPVKWVITHRTLQGHLAQELSNLCSSL